VTTMSPARIRASGPLAAQRREKRCAGRSASLAAMGRPRREAASTRASDLYGECPQRPLTRLAEVPARMQQVLANIIADRAVSWSAADVGVLSGRYAFMVFANG
jgi:hypothetical protein